jgi:hypothetical protein
MVWCPQDICTAVSACSIHEMEVEMYVYVVCMPVSDTAYGI